MNKQVGWFDCIKENIAQAVRENPTIDTAELTEKVRSRVIKELHIVKEDHLIFDWITRLCQEEKHSRDTPIS